MSLALIITLFLIGFVGSFLSGMLGIGGAILNYPMLLYIPVLFGLTGFTAFEVSGIVTVQVLFSTLSGVLAYRKGGYLNKNIIIIMGIGILIGSFTGGFGSSFLTAEQINFVYGILAAIAAVMMFLPKKEVQYLEEDKLRYNSWLAAFLALIVGLGAGIVGAGGAFLLVPIMLVVLKIPTRITITTSLAVTFISSIGATTGKLITNQILFTPALVIIVASLIAAPLGAKIGKKANVKILQGILAVSILATAIKIWVDYFS